jgi:hypothetical protein
MAAPAGPWGAIPGAQAATGQFGFFTAATVNAITATNLFKPIVHLTAFPAGATDEERLAAMSIIVTAVIRAKRQLTRVLEDEEASAAAWAAEFIGADLPAPVANLNHLPNNILDVVAGHVVTLIPGIAGLHAAGVGGGAAGALHGGPNQASYAAMAGINLQALVGPNAAITLASIAAVVCDCMHVLPGARRKAVKESTKAFVYVGIALAKRGTSTREYLRKRVARLREEFDHPDLEADLRLLQRLWSLYLQDITPVQAPGILAGLHAFAPPGAVTFREVLRQAQFGGFTSVVIINHAINTFADFPWQQLVGAGNPLALEYAAFNVAAAVINANAWAAYGQVKATPNAQYRHLIYLEHNGILNICIYLFVRFFVEWTIFLPQWRSMTQK